MKKIIFYFLGIILILSSCKKEESPESIQSILISVESFANTRAGFEVSSQSLSFVWEEGDLVTLYDKSTGENIGDFKFKISNKDIAEFQSISNVLIDDNKTYKVVYPNRKETNYKDVQYDFTNKIVEADIFKFADLCFLEGEYNRSISSQVNLKYQNTAIHVNLKLPTYNYNEAVNGKFESLKVSMDDFTAEFKLSEKSVTDRISLFLAFPFSDNKKNNLIFDIITSNNDVYSTDFLITSFILPGQIYSINFNGEFNSEEVISVELIKNGLPKSDTWVFSDKILDFGFDNFLRDSLLNLYETNPSRKIKIILPNAEYINNSFIGAFESCNNLELVEMPSAISVARGTFAHCENLTTVYAPSLLYLDANVFYNCFKLSNLYLPKVTNILGSAFYNCNSLITLNLPSLENLDQSAFFGLKNLETISLDKIKSFTVGSAFMECISLKYINIPNIKNLSEALFYNCSSLETIDIKDVSYIPSNTFSGCANLKEVKGNNIQEVGNNAFTDCEKLTDIDLSKLARINNNAFQNCSSLQLNELPLLTYMGSNVFDNCGLIKELALPSIIKLSANSFHGNHSIESVILPNATEILLNAFNSSSIKSVYAPKVAKIDEYAFYNCKSLSIIDAENVETIESYAFMSCLSLNEVKFDKLQFIGEQAFTQTSLTSINFPLIKTLNNYQFYNCSSLTSISLDSIEDISCYVFVNCSSLNSISIATKSKLTAVDFSIFDTDKIDLILGAGNGEVNNNEWTFNGETKTFRSITLINN